MFFALARELRHAVRALRRQPTFVAGVVLTFALAIGMNAAMLGLVTRLMLAAPPGIRDPQQVARVQFQYGDKAGEPQVMSTTSYPVFRALAGQSKAFVSAAGVRTESVNIGRGADLEQVPSAQATGDYFSLLGATPLLGRFFGPADDELPSGNPVVVLGHAYWKRHFAADARVLDSKVVINGQEFTVIGVAKPGFNGDGVSPIDVFIPLSAAMRLQGPGWWQNDGYNVVAVVVRRQPDVSASVAAQIASAALRDRQSDGMTLSVVFDPVVPGSSSRTSPQSRIALWLWGVSFIVLLIATANVGTLLLLRAEQRRRDIAVRLALGARVRHLAGQLLAESMVLAFLGAAAGLVLCRWFTTILRVTLLPNVAPTEAFVEQRVLAASVVVAGLAGIVAGLSPLLRVGRRPVSLDLRGGDSGASRRFGFHKSLVGVQVALCTVLLVGAGLFVRSLQRVQSQDLGFSTDHLLYVKLDFQQNLSAADKDSAYEAALQRVRRIPGVMRATFVEGLPFGPHHIPAISIPGWVHPPPWLAQLPIMYAATPDYLDMMNVTLRQGRAITDRDTRGTPLVVLVNETMARSVWPGQSPLGKCVRAGFADPEGDPDDPAASLPCREVVGVVRDSRARSLRPEGGEAALMQYYVPFAQLPPPPEEGIPTVFGALVQVAGDPARLVSTVQRTIQGSTSVSLYAKVSPYQELIDPQLRSWRLGALLFSLFGSLALGITAVGIFGVVSYLSEQRTREIGVRLALGATRAAVGRLIVGDSLRLVVVGLGVGIAAGLAGAPLVRDLLFQTSPWEPSNLGTALLILLGVTAVAALWPAWRAGRVDPLVALRSDG